MKKSESGNYTIYESTDPNALHEYSQALAGELENRDKQLNTDINSLQEENTKSKEEISNIQEKIGDIDTILDTINGEVI